MKAGAPWRLRRLDDATATRARLPVILLAALTAIATVVCLRTACAEAASATILVYHRFGPTVADSMTVTTPVFASQLGYLHDHGYTVVPLRDVVNFAAGRGELPARAVAITADDGHRTVFTEMKPWSRSIGCR